MGLLKDTVAVAWRELRVIVAVSIWVTSIVLSLLLVVSALTLPVFYPTAPSFIYLFLVVSPIHIPFSSSGYESLGTLDCCPFGVGVIAICRDPRSVCHKWC